MDKNAIMTSVQKLRNGLSLLTQRLNTANERADHYGKQLRAIKEANNKCVLHGMAYDPTRTDEMPYHKEKHKLGVKRQTLIDAIEIGGKDG